MRIANYSLIIVGVLLAIGPTKAQSVRKPNIANLVGPTSSAELQSILTDKSGTGPLVFGHAPAFTGIVELHGALSMYGSSGAVPVVATTPINGFYASGQGSVIDICADPAVEWACRPLVAPSRITAQSAIITTSRNGPNDAEQGLFLLMNSNTGAANQWKPHSSYEVAASGGTHVKNGDSIYELKTESCKSGKGRGPSGTGASITDGSCVWGYFMPFSSYAPKQALGLNVLANPGGGITWQLAGALQLMPGFNAIGAFGSEWDMTNYSGVDPYEGSGYSYFNMVLGGPIGDHPLSAHLAIGNSASPSVGKLKGAYKGIIIDGPDTIKDHAIHVRTNSQIGFYDTSTHSIASFFDASTSPFAFIFDGTYSLGAISIKSGDAICMDRTTACIKYDGSKVAIAASLASTGVVTAPTIEATSEFRANGAVGLTGVKTVRDAAGTGSCTMVFAFGLLTGGTC
jgi:hypothetical protein